MMYSYSYKAVFSLPPSLSDSLNAGKEHIPRPERLKYVSSQLAFILLILAFVFERPAVGRAVLSSQFAGQPADGLF